MMRNLEKAKQCFKNFEGFYDRMMRDSLGIDELSDMEDEEFVIYRGLAKSYKEFSELSIGLISQMDEQSQALEEIQNDLKILNRRNLMAMDTDQ